ncbi:MAG: hypothetical protein AAF500_14770 [Myxococcota bacterium]
MNSLSRCQRLLIGHGAFVLLFGFIMGFGFLFFLVEKGLDGGGTGFIELWPIPWRLEIVMPGTYDSWRMAHMEGVVNGLVLWVVALALPLMPFGDKGQLRTTWTMIVVAWTIVIASALDPLFVHSRGLRMGLNTPNTIAFLLFYVGVVSVCVLVAVIGYKALINPGARRDP